MQPAAAAGASGSGVILHDAPGETDADACSTAAATGAQRGDSVLPAHPAALRQRPRLLSGAGQPLALASGLRGH